jgi:hypothetical protein
MTVLTKERTKAADARLLRKLVAGLKAKFPKGSFMLRNMPFTTTELVDELETLITAIETVETLQAQAKTAIEKMRATATRVGPTALALKQSLQTMYGSTGVDSLLVFGVEPKRTPAPRTAEQNVVAVAKARATREARGTKGKRQRLKIKGNVTDVRITPIHAPPPAPVPTDEPPMPEQQSAARAPP